MRLREIGVRAPIAVVPSSIDVARFAAGRRDAATRALLGANGEDRVVLAVARLAKEKHLELALDAIACLRDVRLAIVGDGAQRASLEARARALGVRQRVHFTGALDPATMPAVYAGADAFVFPSPTETQGLVLAEALAAGLPVVAVDVPVNREVLSGFGRLVPSQPAAMAAALAAAVEGPREGAGAAFAVRRFGRRRHAEAVLEIYRSISLCRTFGTPVRDYAPGTHGFR
jgi:1,2-diacylglycerol 3-alpha-glucosyltransferase